MHNAQVVELPAHVWHRLASYIVITGAVVASGFYQGVSPSGDVWTYSDFAPVIFAGDTILTPSPIVP